MRIIKPSYEILTDINGAEILKKIENAGRTCYKSEDKITEDSAAKFVKSLIKSGHHSVIEHVFISVRFICDRGVSHELVRHRLASFSQESTRYCNYTKDKFNNQITFIKPCFDWAKNIKEGTYNNSSCIPKDYRAFYWLTLCLASEQSYLNMIENKATPQEARSVLPNSLKTEIVMTCNLHEWRHVLSLRTSKAAHPQMREIMIPILKEFSEKMPVIFDDINKEN